MGQRLRDVQTQHDRTTISAYYRRGHGFSVFAIESVTFPPVFLKPDNLLRNFQKRRIHGLLPPPESSYVFVTPKHYTTGDKLCQVFFSDFPRVFGVSRTFVNFGQFGNLNPGFDRNFVHIYKILRLNLWNLRRHTRFFGLAVRDYGSGPAGRTFAG